MSLRPGGVSAIAILFLITAVAGLAIGIICLVASTWVATWWTANVTPLLSNFPLIGNFYMDHLADDFANPFWWTVGGAILVVFGALDGITGYGLLKLKKYGYWLCIIISIPLIIIIIGIVFIWYLRKDEVKAAFDIM
ncbi:MAG: hypothetical protein ACTSQI_02955 [Candidatus Helarchaeota archaeon]